MKAAEKIRVSNNALKKSTPYTKAAFFYEREHCWYFRSQTFVVFFLLYFCFIQVLFHADKHYREFELSRYGRKLSLFREMMILAPLSVHPFGYRYE